MESTTSMVLVPGWRWMARTMARLFLYQEASLSFSTLSMARAQFLQAHGFAVPVGHDEGPVGRGIGELAGGLDREGLVSAVQGARGDIDIGVLDRVPHFINAEAPAGQGLGVQLDAHRIFL